MHSLPNRVTAAGIARVLTLGYADTREGKLRLRRAANRAIRALLFMRGRRLQTASLTSVLVLAPHPDDESIGCGGTIATLVREKAEVNVAFLTDGSASHPSHPTVEPLEIAARRRVEARAAAGELGIEHGRTTFMDFPDGTLARLDSAQARKVVEELAGIVAQVAPKAILLPCRSDGSSEHDAAFVLVSRAVARAGLKPRILEFPVWSWWSPSLLLKPLLTSRNVWRVALEDLLPIKARAVGSYTSQTLPIPPETDPAFPEGFASMFLFGDEYFFEH
jgi:LmbE family N-acetylglucosaminyl deacetylase